MVILHGILTALAVLSFVLLLWQWLAGLRFPLHKRLTGQAIAPAVTLLKPLRGRDEHTEACLRSWLAQEYSGEMQFLFGVDSTEDPACRAVRRVLAEFPERNAQLVVCPEQLGINDKVSKLIQLEPRARYEIVVISDADVMVQPDLLINLVQPLAPAVAPPTGETEMVSRRTAGLVSCFYQIANPTTLALSWEATAVNADLWSRVLQIASIRKLDFAIGAVMATRRRCLAEIGGFRAMADFLADDYQLGHRIALRGYGIELCSIPVQCWCMPMEWREVWRHQMRRARTILVSQPLRYLFGILGNPTLWAMAWGLAGVTRWVIEMNQLSSTGTSFAIDLPFSTFGAMIFVLARILFAWDLQWRLTRSNAHTWNLWFVPIKDLLQVAVWAVGFFGNRIEWQGEQYRLRRNGTITKSKPASQ
jgi:ceramide glucosyltransferase